MKTGSFGQENKSDTVKTQSHYQTSATSVWSMPGNSAASIIEPRHMHGNQFVQRLLTKAQQESAERNVRPDVENAILRARGGGQALDSKIRDQVEPVFGYNFSHVRVHTNVESHKLNRALNARAFTIGSDIFFSEGQYNPYDLDCKRLLAHELTHVVQQTGAPQCKLTTSDPGDELEQEADQVAYEVTQMASPGEPTWAPIRGLTENAKISCASSKGQEQPSTKDQNLEKSVAHFALAEWVAKAIRFVTGTTHWLTYNWDRYLSYTIKNPSLSWEKSYVNKALDNAFGNAVSASARSILKAGGKFIAKKSPVLLGAWLGSMISPGLGTVIGAIVGSLIEAAASIIYDIICGNKEAEKAAAEARQEASLASEATSRHFNNIETKANEEIIDSNKRGVLIINDITNQNELSDFEGIVNNETEKIRIPPSEDNLYLFNDMLHDWIFEHAGDEENADKTTVQADWELAIREAKSPQEVNEKRKQMGLPVQPIILEKGEDLDNHPEIFAYQTRRHWRIAGLSTIKAEEIITDFISLKPGSEDIAGEMYSRYNNKTYIFFDTNKENIDRLSNFVVTNLEKKPEFLDQLSESESAISANHFILDCTLNLDISDGSVYVNKWEYKLYKAGPVISFTVSPD